MSTEDEFGERLKRILAPRANSGILADVAAAADKKEADQSLSSEAQKLENDRLRETLNDQRDARAQRGKYARNVFGLVCTWIAALLTILLAQGFCPKWRPLSDKVLIALITSMSVNLIGTLVIVLKYIFRDPPKST